MTVTTTSAFTGPYTPNGSTTAFPFDFRALTASEVLVVRRSSLSGMDQVLGGYAVTLTSTGGTVTFGTAPVVGDPIYIISNPRFDQQINFANQGSWSPSANNEALDRADVRDIYLKDNLARTIRSSDQMDALPAADGRKGTILGFNVSSGLRELLSYSGLAALIAGPVSAFLSALAKGDPGGNILAIGLFTAASGLSIPLGTDLVQTSGYGSIGAGVAQYIADAAVDAAYVTANPRTSFRSANSRGFRLDVSHGLSLPQVGAIADTTAFTGTTFNGTDNTAAYNAAKKALGNGGGTLRIPQGAGGYRFTAKLTHTEGINIQGDGWHENPGQIGVTTYVGIQRFPGSVMCFDANVPGFEFIPFTDNNADATAYEYQSAVYSSLSRVMLYGGGGTSTAAHGLFSRTILFADQVRVTNFAGNGVHFVAYPTPHPQPYGNADLSQCRSVHVDHCGCHGWYLLGYDVNVVTTIGCSSVNNGGCGLLDMSFLGNIHLGFHSSINNLSHPSSGLPTSVGQRAFVLSGTNSSGYIDSTGWPGLSDINAGSYVTTSTVGFHIFLGCYAEPGVGGQPSIIAPSLVLGGTLASSMPGVASLVPGSAVATAINSKNLSSVDTFSSLAAFFHFDDAIVSNNIHGTGGLTVTGLGTGAEFKLYPTAGPADGLTMNAGAGLTTYNSNQHSFAAANGAAMLDLTVGGPNLPVGSVYKINGTRVLGPAAAMSAGTATDLPTVIALANEMLAKLRTQGVIQ